MLTRTSAAGTQIVAKGGGCVVWVKHTDAENLYIPKGVVGIVLSWIISPASQSIILCTSRMHTGHARTRTRLGSHSFGSKEQNEQTTQTTHAHAHTHAHARTHAFSAA